MIIPAKVGIKSCRFANSFMHTWTYLPSWSCVCMISQITSLLLVSLLFIAIPTPFLNFKFLFISYPMMPDIYVIVNLKMYTSFKVLKLFRKTSSPVQYSSPVVQSNEWRHPSISSPFGHCYVPDVNGKWDTCHDPIHAYL